MGADTKKGLNADTKTATKKPTQKAAEAASEFIGNKIADKIGNPKPAPQANSTNIQEISILPDKKRKNAEWVKTSIIKRSTMKYVSY